MDEWRDVTGYEGRYQVSAAGLVRNVRRGNLLRPRPSPRGYLSVRLYRDAVGTNFLVHRLVAAAFIGPIPAGRHVNHKNGPKGDNRLINLEVVTPLENHRHAKSLGLIQSIKGEANINAKLTEPQVREIRRLRQEGMRPRRLAKRFGVSKTTILLIVSRRQWKHVA
jgi:hypothetical protein